MTRETRTARGTVYHHAPETVCALNLDTGKVEEMEVESYSYVSDYMRDRISEQIRLEWAKQWVRSARAWFREVGE